jgi:L-threonylcarbamoyladenylate synthase
MAILPPDDAGIKACVAQLRSGKPVAIPTETVYGLAADATDGAAIAGIYKLKDRPSFNPLICHVADAQAAQLLGVFNDAAIKLATAFWPGPLTLVVPRQADCSVDPLACAGLDSLAIRVPAHRLAQKVLHLFNGPLVAPSANPSGRLSPSAAPHVADTLPHIDVLDGGACRIGVESTIIGCLDDTPLWLRAGGIARHDIETVLGQSVSDVPDDTETQAKLAPGRLMRHYAPQSRLRLNAETASENELLIGFGPDAPSHCAANLSQNADLAKAAAALFAMLHQLDAQAAAQGKTLAVMPIPNHGLGEAINDRLNRAANR